MGKSGLPKGAQNLPPLFWERKLNGKGPNREAPFKKILWAKKQPFFEKSFQKKKPRPPLF